MLRLLVWTLTIAMALFGVLIAARAFHGPFAAPVPVNSPLNVESFFGLAAILLLLAQSKPSQPEPKKYVQRLDRRDAAVLGGLAVLVAAAFWGSARDYFLSDDFYHLKSKHDWHTVLAHFLQPGSDGFYRPLGDLSLALTSVWAGLSPVSWHAAGFALHAANSMLLYLLARRLKLSRLAAGFGAALFVLHGSRPEAVVWLASRFDLLATFFVLLALLAFLASWDQPGRFGAGYRAISLLAMLLALLSKESAYSLPLLLAVLLLSSGELLTRRSGFALAPYFAIAAGLLASRWLLFGGIGGYVDSQGRAEALTPTIVPVVKLFALRLWAILFFPINWSIQPGLAVGLLMVLYVAALLLLFRVRLARRSLVVPMGFLLASCLPALQQLMIGVDLEKARQLYLPAAGFCLLLATLAEGLNRKAFWIAPIIVLAFQSAVLLHNLGGWADASERAKAACSVAAACQDHKGRMAVIGLPSRLNGVYFFANGFRECVEQQGEGAAGDIDLYSPDQSWNRGDYSCVLRWNALQSELLPQR
ncbi:MAG TPA: hypothetical protein VEV17_18355 [Bryobacteraceae bacterium]|nr:hypothetical protein [Bryobacteraceae bacterium]